MYFYNRRFIIGSITLQWRHKSISS